MGLGNARRVWRTINARVYHITAKNAENTGISVPTLTQKVKVAMYKLKEFLNSVMRWSMLCVPLWH
jgi:hypothetical protein